MDLSLTEDQQNIRDTVLKHCSRFPTNTGWNATATGSSRTISTQSMAEAGWLGIAMPEAVGGAGLGITEAAIMMQAVAESGGGMAAASAIHMNIFGLQPVVVFGTDEQKQRMLPPLMRGEDKACFAVTEPNTGLDTTKLKTRAERATAAIWSTARRSGSRRRRSPTRCCCWRAPPRSRQVKRKTDGLSACSTPISTAASRGARDRQDGPQGGRFQHAVHRGPVGSRTRTASARRARASSTSCTASIPSAS